MKTYKATGLFITAFKRLVGFRLRVSGLEHLTDEPTLYVANHFTRFETAMVPYALYRADRRPVKSLATHSIFKGVMAKYLRAVGVISVRDPRRNRMIVSDLMTGACDWIIYPEGGLVKNKKTTDGKRLRVERAGRCRPPHTGAALLALKSEICKRRYCDACERDDDQRRSFYEQEFDVTDPAEVAPTPAVIVPVTITYHSHAPGTNLIHRAARCLLRRLDPIFEEELQVEGSILLGRTEMSIHFGEPINVASYLDRTTMLARRLMGVFSEERTANIGLRRQATKLTDDAMRRVYAQLEVSFEHLFCYGLHTIRQEHVSVSEFRRVLYLAIEELQARHDVRLHPELRNGVAGLVTGDSFPPLDRAEARAIRERLVERENGDYRINRDALTDPCDFHRVRLERMVRVLANELEANRPAASIVERCVNLSSSRIAPRVSRAMRSREDDRFRDDHQEATGTHPEQCERDRGPFFLKARGSRRGVVLVHGYLSSPRQMEPMAEHLRRLGWNVYAVRLPGHGTSPSQLSNVRWEQWVKSVMRGCALVRQHCDSVSLVGFSLGGVLAFIAAHRCKEAVDAVVSINAPFKLRDRRVWLVHPILAWHRMIKRIGIGNGQVQVVNRSESPDMNYPEYSLSSVRELRRAVTACRKCLSDLRIPALLVQGTDDPVVDPTGARQAASRLSPSGAMIVEPPFDRHVIVRGDGAAAVFDTISSFLDPRTVSSVRRRRSVLREQTAGAQQNQPS